MKIVDGIRPAVTGTTTLAAALPGTLQTLVLTNVFTEIKSSRVQSRETCKNAAVIWQPTTNHFVDPENPSEQDFCVATCH